MLELASMGTAADEPPYDSCASCGTERDVFPFGDPEHHLHTCLPCADHWGWRIHGAPPLESRLPQSARGVPQYAPRPRTAPSHAIRLPVISPGPILGRILIAIVASIAGYAAHMLLQRYWR